MRTRIFRRLGLEPMAHRPPLVRRFWVYSAAAYLLPVVAQVAFPIDTSSIDELVWLVTLTPAFILSLHYGLRGALVALVLGTALLVTVQLTLALNYTADDPRVIVPIYIAYGVLAVSVGWLSEELHEHYELALELQAKQKTDGLVKLAAGIAHDFNNILTSMVANAELIAGVDSDGSPEADEELARLKAAATRGAGIVRNLLGLSRRGMLTRRMLDLSDFARELRPRLERLASEAVRVELICDDDVPAVAVDRRAVEEILVNLVTNARDAMPGGGELRVEVATERLGRDRYEDRGWGDPGEYVRVTVSDSGSGMDQDAVGRIFEPFFTTKDPGEGIGLGMAMVYGLVKQHRGFVDVQSATRRGTEVHVYFPVTKEPASAPAPTPAKPRGGSETILVVEDEEPIRRAAERILRRFGYSVEVAATGEEALDACRRHGRAIALVLCDVLLPTLTGPEVYREISAHHPSPPGFLFMSGYPADHLEEESGFDRHLPFLPKPWTAEDLLNAVRKTLDSPDGRGVG